MADRRFVYILQSESDPKRHYTGLTRDVEQRLQWHNNGPTGLTTLQRPWRVVISIEFADSRVAGRFERYLKSASGRAFAKRQSAILSAIAAARGAN